MRPHVDIQMPVKHNGFIAGAVIQRLLLQDVDFSFYVDAGEDFPFFGNDGAVPFAELDDASFTAQHPVATNTYGLIEVPTQYEVQVQSMLLDLVSPSARALKRIKTTICAAFKRNRMRHLGTAEFVYLADPDVLLPEQPVLGAMVRGLQRHPQLGAVGVCYQKSSHVAAGAMLLRRKDFLRVGEIRGAGASCICSYIQKKLTELGLHTVPLRTIRATHLKSDYNKVYANEHSALSDDAVVEMGDGLLDQHALETTVTTHAGRFRVVFQ